MSDPSDLITFQNSIQPSLTFTSNKTCLVISLQLLWGSCSYCKIDFLCCFLCSSFFIFHSNTSLQEGKALAVLSTSRSTTIYRSLSESSIPKLCMTCSPTDLSRAHTVIVTGSLPWSFWCCIGLLALGNKTPSGTKVKWKIKLQIYFAVSSLLLKSSSHWGETA